MRGCALRGLEHDLSEQIGGGASRCTSGGGRPLGRSSIAPEPRGCGFDCQPCRRTRARAPCCECGGRLGAKLAQLGVLPLSSCMSLFGTLYAAVSSILEMTGDGMMV